MATYKGIKGVKVQSKASDPTASEAEGTVWYNTASTALKYAIAGAGAWASGTTVNTACSEGASANSTNGTSDALKFGVTIAKPAPGNHTKLTELWNGSTWTEVADLSTGRVELGYGSQGTQAACLATGGYISPNYQVITEEWTKPQNVKVITD